MMQFQTANFQAANFQVMIISAIAVFFLFVEFGKRVALIAAMLGMLAWVAVKVHMESVDKKLGDKREFSMGDVVSSATSSSTGLVSSDKLFLQSIPQDAPYQVPINEEAWSHIAKHPVLTRAFKRLIDSKSRRGPSLSLALSTLDRFISICDTLLLPARIPTGPGNTRAHEIAKQRVADAFMLRNEAIDQMSTITMEFAKRNKPLMKAISVTRDYSHQLLMKVVAKWKRALPGLGNGMPPYGISELNTESMYR